jgi:heme/copper-type cytochrome/quinol oxidase subunit 1
MTVSKKKFIFIFIFSGFVFMFIITSLLGSTGVRGMPKYPDSYLKTASPVAWKQTVSNFILPLKVVLTGPLALSEVKLLKDDPPPPLVAFYFMVYWSLLAISLHYCLSKWLFIPKKPSLK